MFSCINWLSSARPMIQIALGLCPALLMAASDAPVPFKEKGYLEVRFVINEETHPNDVFCEIWAAEPERPGETRRIGSDNTAPFKTFALVGKWWELLGEFVVNAGIEWSYHDDFAVTDESGQTYRINRAALEKYPSLARRLKAARFSFDRIEVFASAATEMRETKTIKFTVKPSDVIIPPDGQAPYMAAPGSPPHWADGISISDAGINPSTSDEALRREWSGLTGLHKRAPHRPHVSVIGLRIPTGELVAIGRDFEKYEKADQALQDEYALLESDFKPASLPEAFTGAGPLAQPYQEELGEAEYFVHEGRVGLRNKDGVVLQPDIYTEGAPLRRSRFALGFRPDAGVPHEVFHIYDAKGRRISVAGHSEFHRVFDWSPTEFLVVVLRAGADPVYTSVRKIGRQPDLSHLFLPPDELDEFIAWDQSRKVRSAGGIFDYFPADLFYIDHKTLRVRKTEFKYTVKFRSEY